MNHAGKRTSISFTSEAAARDAARKVEAASVLGQVYTPRPAAAVTVPTFGKVAAEALKLHAQTRTLRWSTTTSHEWFLDKHLLPKWGDTPVVEAAFTRLEIKKFIAECRTKLADSTLKTALPGLSRILDHATEMGLLKTNPMRGGKLWQPTARAEVDPFSASELRAILGAARTVDADFAVQIQAMAQTGMRPGEAAAIRRRDLDGQTVAISGSWSRKGRGPTKNAHSVRKVRGGPSPSPRTWQRGNLGPVVPLRRRVWTASRYWRRLHQIPTPRFSRHQGAR